MLQQIASQPTAPPPPPRPRSKIRGKPRPRRPGRAGTPPQRRACRRGHPSPPRSASRHRRRSHRGRPPSRPRRGAPPRRHPRGQQTAVRDADAARFKAGRLAEETGEPFEVLILAGGGLVLVPARAIEPPRARMPASPGTSTGAGTRKAGPPEAAPELHHLTIDRFPPGHPCGSTGSRSTSRFSPRPAGAAPGLAQSVATAVHGGHRLLIFPRADPLVRLAVPPASAERLITPASSRVSGTADSPSHCSCSAS